MSKLVLLFNMAICLNIFAGNQIRNDATGETSLKGLLLKAKQYEKIQLDSALSFYLCAADIIEKKSPDLLNKIYNTDIANIYKSIASLFLLKSDEQKADLYLNKGLHLIINNKDRVSLNLIADFYCIYSVLQLTSYDNSRLALLYALKANEIYLKNNDSIGMAYCHYLYGRFNIYNKVADKALMHYRKALNLLKNKSAEYRLRIKIYFQLAEILRHMGKIDEAIDYWEKSQTLIIQNGDSVYLSRNFNQMGILNSFRNETRFTKTPFFFKKALESAAKTGNIIEEINSLNNLAYYYISCKNFDSSIVFSNKAFILAKQNTLSKNMIAAIVYNLFNVYFEKEDFKRAIKFHISYYHYTVNHLNSNSRKMLLEMETKYETNKKEQQILLNNLIIGEKNKIIERYFIGVAVLLVLLLAIASHVFIVSKKNKLLLHQNKAIMHANLDLETIIENKEKLSTVINDKYYSSSLSEQDKADIYINLLTIFNQKKPYLDKDFTIERLSDLINVNRTYISQVINEKTNDNFSNFINKYRIADARIFLEKPENSNSLIKSIYDRFGFKSDKYFCEVFKKETGFSPALYRKNCLKSL